MPPQDVSVDRGAGGVRQGGSLFIAIAWKRIGDKVGAQPPVLEIGFGPPTADVGSIWSSQKARKRHFQKTSKERVLYFDPLHNLIKMLLSH